MSAKSDRAAHAANDTNSWSNTEELPANDTSYQPVSHISAPDAFGALADAVTVHINAPTRLKDRRQRVILVSQLLREAFCLRASMLTPLPKQLGPNHDLAADYIYEQLDRWATQPALADLFETIGLAENMRPIIIDAAIQRVPAEEIGMWLSVEFGDLTATRAVAHCRRYVAMKISNALFDLSSAQPSIELAGVKAQQLQLDDWAAPTGEIKQSLHYQMVIAPFLSFFHEIATGRDASPAR